MSDLTKRLCRPGYDLQKEQAIQEAIIEIRELRAKIEAIPYGAIAKTLTEVMDIAAANGADSRSMPDEYVEVAAWLCGIPGAQPAPSVPDFSNTKDAARYRWLRENGLANEKRESRAVLPRGGKKASMAFRYWTAPEELDMTIDAMIAAAPEAKP